MSERHYLAGIAHVYAVVTPVVVQVFDDTKPGNALLVLPASAAWVEPCRRCGLAMLHVGVRHDTTAKRVLTGCARCYSNLTSWYRKVRLYDKAHRAWRRLNRTMRAIAREAKSRAPARQEGGAL